MEINTPACDPDCVLTQLSTLVWIREIVDQGRGGGERPVAPWEPVKGRAMTIGSPLDQAQPQRQELSELRGPTSQV